MYITIPTIISELHDIIELILPAPKANPID